MRDAFDEMHAFAALVALCAASCGGMTSSGTSQSSPGDTGGRSGGGSGRGAGGSSAGSAGVISNGGGPILQPPNEPPPPDPPPQCAAVALSYEFGDAATCSWRIPPPPPGQKFMSNLVNLQLDSGDGGSRKSLYLVSTLADCNAAPDAWYYDDEESPTYLALCPETCRRYSSTGAAELYIVFGCSGPWPLL
jgi:hypothetical protein